MLARLALAPLLGAAQVPAPPAAALEWTAPPECPDQAAVAAAIDRRLGRPLRPDEAVVEGRVARDGARRFSLRLRLTAGSRRETREVVDPSCAALVDAVALLVAAAVEPAALVPAPEPAADEPAADEPDAPAVVTDPAPDPEPDPEPRVEAAVAAPPVEPLAPEPAPSDVSQSMSRRIGGFARLHGGGELGAVPGATGVVGLAGGLLGRRWRLELGGLFVAPRTAVRDGIEVRVALFAGSVLGCGRLGRGALEVPLCAGIEAGAMRGEARGLPSGRAASQGWFAGVVGASAVWHAGARWSLWFGLQVAMAPVYPVFELSNSARSQELWKPVPASGRLLLGAEVRLGDPW